MLKFTSIVGYTSCGPTYIESFLTIFGQCINVLNFNRHYINKIDKHVACVSNTMFSLFFICITRILLELVIHT